MANIEIDSFIATADEETLTAVEVLIERTRAARIEARNANLGPFVWVISQDVPEQGHVAGRIVQVTKARALELEAAGSHKLATDVEVAAYNGRAA